MLWLKQLFLAILEFFSAEIKKDTKASNADKTPEKLQSAWRERIIEAERKAKQEAKEKPAEKPAPTEEKKEAPAKEKKAEEKPAEKPSEEKKE